MRTATVTVAFQDLQEHVLRNPGNVFQAADDRAAHLEELGFVTLAPADPKPARKKAVKK
jgi:hypothetical protein